MIEVIRTDANHADFQALVGELDAELRERDGADNAYYAQFNHIAAIKQAIVAYEDGLPLGCGGIKPFATDAMEVKRMYVKPAARGKGIATQVLYALEAWAAELGYARCVLETGKRQPEAIQLYTRRGYAVIPNYGQYIGVDNSVCFEKMLI